MSSKLKRKSHAVLILLAIVILLQRYSLHTAPLHGDICAYAVLGHEMMHGRLLYSDLWERKPPLLYLTYAAAELVTGYGPDEIFLLGVVASLASLVLIYQIGRSNSRGDAAGLFAAGLWMILNCDLDLAANQPDPEVFINVCLLAAFFVLVRWRSKGISPSPGTQGEGWGEGDFESRSPLTTLNHPHPNPLPEYRERGPDAVQLVGSILLGLFLSAATLYKHNCAIVCAGLLAGHLLVSRNRWFSRRFLEAFIAGGVICAVWAGMLGYFAATGRAHAFIDVLFHQNVSYSGNVTKNLDKSVEFSRLFPSFMIWMIAPGLLVMVLIAFSLRGDRVRGLKDEWRLLIAWSIGTWPTIALTGYLFPHYFQLWLPIACIAGGWAAGALLAKPSRVSPVIAVGALAISFAFLIFRQGTEFLLTPEQWVQRQFPYFNLAAQNKLGTDLGTLLKPDEQFWEMGEDNALYFFSKHSPPTGLLFIDPFIFGDEKQVYWARLMRDLNRSRPALVILSDNWTSFFPADAPVVPWISQNYSRWDTPLGWPHYQLLVRRGSELQKRITTQPRS